MSRVGKCIDNGPMEGLFGNIKVEKYYLKKYTTLSELEKDISEYNLLLLDVMMGEISGFKMARMLRDNPKTAAIPVIFLTAKDTENDKLTGFNIGADDYISKPFSIREVLARVKAVLRRIENKKVEDTPNVELVYENLKMSVGNKKVLLNGEEIPFTKKEFEILRLFLENKNRVFTREEMLTRVWSDEVIVLDRTIDVNITRLRKKIGEYGKNIVTRLGYGYCFEG